MKLNRRDFKLILFCLPLLCSSVLIGGIITAHRASASAKSQSNPSITMQEAYVLSDKVAKKLDSKSELSSITSVDDPIDMNVKYVTDGRRKNWNITFLAPHTNKLLIITIHSGKSYKETPGTGTGTVVN